MTAVPLLVCALSLASSAAVVKSEAGSSTAVVTVAADVDEVYDAIADPARWPALFSDAVRVERDADGVDWRIRSHLLGGNMKLSVTKARRPRALSFDIVDAALGAGGHVDVWLEPAGGKTTRVTYTLATTVPLGIVSESLVRRHREQKLLTDLADLERHFGGR